MDSQKSDYVVLVKFPTRGRPEKFFTVLNRYYHGAKQKHLTKFLVTCDLDDPTMNNETVVAKLKTYNNLQFRFGTSRTKIEAVNADMDLAGDYDILLLASDDMVPEVKGYDQLIRERMADLYPDTDGVLWFFDGYRRDFNTLCILGKKYYDRFGYIYHPSYKSFWCDNEFTDVARGLGLQTFTDQVVIRHIHPDWIQRDPGARAAFSAVHPTSRDIGIDATFMKNLPHEGVDAANYRARKAAGFLP